MKHQGFFLLALLLCLAPPTRAQAARDLDLDRIADKLWRVIDMTKQYQPPFQAHVTLEAPDGERLALTFQGESARILIHHDVIVLERKQEIPSDIPEEALGQYFIPYRPKWGKTRWWRERVKQEGQDLSKVWKLFLFHKSGRELEI